ncbi:MAG: YceI family protein [Polyangiaceae bacterium]|nr:YceI family protein [Polyangiaceae bacterium]
MPLSTESRSRSPRSRRSFFAAMTTVALVTAFGVGAVAPQSAVAAPTQGKAFKILPASTVEFTAKITGGSFVATSSKLRGSVVYDASSKTLARGKIMVDADSFKTGMSLRDKHMADKYLKAAAHPFITLKITGGNIALKAGSRGTVDGKFTVRGKSKKVKLRAKIEKVGGEIVVTSVFPINITDFGIAQPRFTVVKMNKKVNVKVRLVLKNPKSRQSLASTGI